MTKGAKFLIFTGAKREPISHISLIINRVSPAGGTAAPPVPTYTSAAYGCALAHSPQTTRGVRAKFYSRLSQHGSHAAPLHLRGALPVRSRGMPPGVARPVSMYHRRCIHFLLWASIPGGTRFITRQPTVSSTTANLAEAQPRSPAPVSTEGRSGVGGSSDGQNKHWWVRLMRYAPPKSVCLFPSTGPPRDHGALHCHWTAIATKPIGQRVTVQTRGILHGPEEQSRPRGGKSIGVTDQPQYPRL